MSNVVPFRCRSWPKGKVLYLAYGSNINPEQMLRRCPGARMVGKGYMEDAKLTFRYVADIEFAPGGKLPYVLWEISYANEFDLDRHEGVPVNYSKEYVDLDDGRTALLYKMNCEGVAPPSPEYFHRIKTGYERFKLNLKFLRTALDESWENKQHSPETRRRINGRRLLRSKRILEREAKERAKIEKETRCKLPMEVVHNHLEAKHAGRVRHVSGKAERKPRHKNLSEWMEDYKNGRL